MYFPRFETYRENIEGHFWFPTYTRSDDFLHFTGGDVHIRMSVRYYELQTLPRFDSPASRSFGSLNFPAFPSAAAQVAMREMRSMN